MLIEFMFAFRYKYGVVALMATTDARRLDDKKVLWCRIPSSSKKELIAGCLHGPLMLMLMLMLFFVRSNVFTCQED